MQWLKFDDDVVSTVSAFEVYSISVSITACNFSYIVL